MNTNRLCKLPHSVGETIFEKSSGTTIFQPMLCPAHLQYMYGISEGDVRMQPTDFTKQITNEFMYSGRRGYTLFARQSWRSADECDTLVFRNGDVIFPTAEYMSSIVQQLNNETDALRLLTKSDTGVCSRPITKFLRKLMFRRRREPSEMLQTSASSDISSSLSQLEANVGDEARDEIVTNLHLFYYAHAFYPLKNAFDAQAEPPEMAKQYYYFRSLWRDLKLSYEIAESVRDLFAEMYSQMIPESDKYSGQFWRTLKGIDVPVGRDIDRDARPKCVGDTDRQAQQESSCPEAARVFASADKHLWQAKIFPNTLPRPFYFTHSISIPNCEFIAEKGFVATRDIYHDEELTLEPFEDRAQHVPLSYWAMLNMLRKKPSDECDSNISDIRQPKEPRELQQPYSEKIHVRGRCLTQLIM